MSAASRFLILAAAVLAVALLIAEGVRQATKKRTLAVERSRTKGSAPTSSTKPHTPPSPRGHWFKDVSIETHLDFEPAVGPLGTYFMPEINGSGGALLDYDNDGNLDLFLVNMGKSPMATREFAADVRLSHALYRQESDGTFSDRTDEVGLAKTQRTDVPQLGIGAAVGDMNNDGFVDLYITNYGPDQLFINRHGLAFEDATEATGLGCSDWGTAAAFFDYDRDGWLDLIVVNYSSDERYGHSIACGFTDGVSYCGPHKFQPTIDRLYRNDGALSLKNGVPSFTDVTHTAGLDSVTSYGLGLAVCDFDRDGWPDIFIASDMDENRLWINQHDGTFRDEAQPRGVAVNGDGAVQGCMGVAVGDVDQDMDFDLVVTNLVTEGSTLYVNDGGGSFTDMSRASGIAASTLRHTGWGVALVDLDLDGDLDMPQTNGFVVPRGSMFPPHGEDQFQPRVEEVTNPIAFLSPYFDRSLLLLQSGPNRFSDKSLQAGDFATADGSQRALICGDVDRDGDVDLVTTAVGQPARFYQNEFPRSGHWLKVSCRLPQQHRDAYGTVVRLQAGNKNWIAQMVPSSSYLASHDPAMHFGLGGVAHVDAIEVTWPDGSREKFVGTPVDQHLVLAKGEGQPAEKTE